MDNRLILPLLCAASVAFAAAPFSHNEKPIATARHSAEKTAPIVTTFDITRPKDDADKLRFTLSVHNNTSKMKGKGETAFEESWNSKGQHGSFTAVAVLRSDNFPIESTVQFVLP